MSSSNLFSHTLRDPLWRDIGLSAPFLELFNSGGMQKLAKIKQLGPTYLLYPGALHTRLNHSLGVYHATKMIISSLLERDNSFKIDQEYYNALLAAAMLHDIGHFPYAHALKDVVKKDHESLGAAYIGEDSHIVSILQDSIGCSVEMVQLIIDLSLPTTDATLLLFRNLLSGTLDPDKLDYLNRDALFCGVPYGIQDSSYIFRNLRVIDKSEIGLSFDAVGAVEHLLFAKYMMYRNVYWHEVTRSATAMIKKSLLLALQNNDIREESLYYLDDYTFSLMVEKQCNEESLYLFNRVSDGKLLRRKGVLSQRESSLYQDFTLRSQAEKELYERVKKRYPQLRESEVIIDIPEKISFESDILLSCEDGSTLPFSSVSELFTSEVVHMFSKTLRKISLYLPSYVENSFYQEEFEEVVSSYE